MAKDSGTTTQSSQPWSGQQQPLLTGYADAGKLLDSGGPQYFGTQQFDAKGNPVASYGQSTVASWNPQLQAANQKLYDTGQASTATQGAWAGLNPMLSGQGASQQGLAAIAGGQGSMMPQMQTMGSNISQAANNWRQPLADSLQGITGGPGYYNSLDTMLGGLTGSRGAGTNDQIRADTNDLITGQAQAANPAFASLGLTANGGYLNSNPYLDSMFGNASRAVTDAYQTATTPQIESQFGRSSGGYGSGAMANAQGQAEKNLGLSLDNLGSNIYGTNYANERSLQNQAASTLGSQFIQGQGLRAQTAQASAAQAAQDQALKLQATGQLAGQANADVANKISAASTLGNINNQDIQSQLATMNSLGSLGNQDIANRTQAYSTGGQQQLSALGLAPQMQQMGYNDINAMTTAGQNQQGQNQQLLNAQIGAWDFGQNAPGNNLNAYMARITGGQNPGGVTSTTSTGSPLSMFGGALGAGASGMQGLSYARAMGWV